MSSLIHGVSPALLAQILAELGPRYGWAFNSEPVCIVARMLQREIDGHGNTRSALRILQDTCRAKNLEKLKRFQDFEEAGRASRYDQAPEEPN